MSAVDRLTQLVEAMDPEELQEFACTLSPAEFDVLEQVIRHLPHARWEPLPHQVPPEADVEWVLWLLLAGRGAGKTDACASAMDAHAKGPACDPAVPGGHRMGIIAPTLGDGSEACVNGPSGLIAHNPQVVERTQKGGTRVIWPNGAQARLFGTYTRQDVNRLRAGGNRCFVWCEELAAWRYLRACWNHMYLGLRLGPHPRIVASTTPKNREHLRKLIALPTTVVTKARTADNPHLAPEVRKRYEETYGGTRLGRQELDAELLDDVEGAMWKQDWIEIGRVEHDDAPAQYRRIVVGVDPSWGTTHDECGIIAAAKGWDDHAYVLADYSVRGGPTAWANAAANLYWQLEADAMVVERNFQGEQVELAMLTIDHPLGRPPVTFVNASRGKALRAEPITILYEQGYNREAPIIHHVGRQHLDGLEWQMCNWVPGQPEDEDPDEETFGADDAPGMESEGDDDTDRPSEFSPDRVDALVFVLTDLMAGAEGPASLLVPTGRIAAPQRRGRGLG